MKDYFPDGTIIDDWFYDIPNPNISDYKRKYILTDYNIYDDGKVYTKEIQNLIDLIYENNGGLLVIPKGTYLTGSLDFKQGVDLYLDDEAILMGSDDISDYELAITRIEGETCKYFKALINATNVEGFKIFGSGTIDGNGYRSWKAFWLRMKWNPKCLNKDEQRPRLIYIANSNNILIKDVHLKNSHFWTTHIYKCSHVKYINCNIFSPKEPIKAPSTDAIDIDASKYVLVKNCYLEVNDDSVVLKGGKGIDADTNKDNGSNEYIIIEDCVYGFCHGCLTLGSESVHNRNIIMRRIKVLEGKNLLWLKMRPDTPQHYEFIKIDDVVGNVTSFININPWTQFLDLKGQDIKKSTAHDITISNCEIDCLNNFHVKRNDLEYKLYNFKFLNLKLKTKKDNINKDIIDNLELINVNVEII